VECHDGVVSNGIAALAPTVAQSTVTATAISKYSLPEPRFMFASYPFDSQ